MRCLDSRQITNEPPMPLPSTELDTLIRVAAFEHVRQLAQLHDQLTARELKPGFVFQERRIPLVNPQRGIFKPQQMRGTKRYSLHSFRDGMRQL
jgi:hypothetical protein